MSAIADDGPPPRLTARDLEAAANLVFLSESSSGGGERPPRLGCSSSSSSSSAPSVNTRAVIGRPPIVDDALDEDTTGPLARRLRYRSIAALYAATVPIDGKRRARPRD